MSCQLLSEEDVRIVGLLEHQLQLIQLSLSEGCATPLQPAISLWRCCTLGMTHCEGSHPAACDSLRNTLRILNGFHNLHITEVKNANNILLL